MRYVALKTIRELADHAETLERLGQDPVELLRMITWISRRESDAPHVDPQQLQEMMLKRWDTLNEACRVFLTYYLKTLTERNS